MPLLGRLVRSDSRHPDDLRRPGPGAPRRPAGRRGANRVTSARRPVLRHPEGALVEKPASPSSCSCPSRSPCTCWTARPPSCGSTPTGAPPTSCCALLRTRFPAAEDLERDVRVTVAKLTEPGGPVPGRSARPDRWRQRRVTRNDQATLPSGGCDRRWYQMRTQQARAAGYVEAASGLGRGRDAGMSDFTDLQDQAPEDGLDRRQMIKRAALVGGALVWATPVVPEHRRHRVRDGRQPRRRRRGSGAVRSDHRAPLRDRGELHLLVGEVPRRWKRHARRVRHHINVAESNGSNPDPICAAGETPSTRQIPAVRRSTAAQQAPWMPTETCASRFQRLHAAGLDRPRRLWGRNRQPLRVGKHRRRIRPSRSSERRWPRLPPEAGRGPFCFAKP